MSQTIDAEVSAVAAEVPKDLQVKASEAVLSPFTVETLVERVELVKEAMRRCMVEDLHYGKIPGCGKKPVLLKPGAEMLGTLFNLGQRYRMQERLLPGDHVVYTVTCTQFYRPTGAAIADGLGACSSLEYKWRIQTEPRTLDNGKVIEPKYTAHDFLNNALKIAAKRALVASIINATGVSSLFNQDLEDNPDQYREQDQQQPAHKPQNGNGNQTAPRPAQADPLAVPADWSPGKREEITGYVVRAWSNDYQGKRYYFAKLKDGKQLQVTDPALGEELLKKAGQTLRALMEHSPKPGKAYLIAFAREQAAAPAAKVAEDADDGELAEVAPPKPVPPPPPQKFSGVVDQAWKQGEPGHYTYLVRVGGIHLQTRTPELGERLLAMQGQMLKAVVRPGSQPSTMDFIRFDEPPTVVENPAADRVGRRKAAKAKHEAKGKVPEGQTA